jgi:hypothetical protein
MIEFIAFTIFIIAFFVLLYRNIYLSLKLASLRIDFLKSSLDKTVLAEKLLDASARNLMHTDEVSDAFLKFVSDSRDWAYQYIDDVQASLNKFITDIEPEIAYFDEYGLVGDAYPHYHSMKKISVAYKELKKLLPEDYGKIDT